MREIKFRAWLKDEKRMTNVVRLDLLENDDNDICIIYRVKPHLLGKKHSKDFELMQYTGLKDNNYDEIYEGDIVEILTEVEEYGIVKFLDGAFYVEADGFRVNFYDNIRGGDVLVIGNIYENKELLG